MTEDDFGLKAAVRHSIIDRIKRIDAIEEAVIYGSRAMGRHKAGSDIDLTLKGRELSLTSLNALATALDDLLLPFTFDLSIYDAIENQDLKDHIDRVGRVLFRR